MALQTINPPNRNFPEFLSGGGEMGQMIREYDWSKTSLGPVDTWPQSLRTCVRIMLTSRQPIWIGWGKELIKLYNDPYKAIVKGKHPWALGTPASIVWKEIWDEIGPMLKKVMEQDEGTYAESQLLIMERNGYPEETYYTFSYTPISGDEGRPAGMICANSDDTERIISERQFRTLTQLGKSLTDAKTDAHVINDTILTLQSNPQDFPYALYYSMDENIARFSASTGFDMEKANIPLQIDLTMEGELQSMLNEVFTTRKMGVWADVRKKFGELPKGAWEIRSDKMIILPIVQASAKEAYGFLIVGCNPYRPIDEKYSSFFSLSADQIAASFANVRVLEEERKRAAALAEIDKAKTIFFSNISHEFRTPLTLLLGPIEDALNNPLIDPEFKVSMDLAHRNALRMQKLVNTLLDFSRIEAGRMEGTYRRVDIATFTEELASTFRSAIESAGMKLLIHSNAISDDVYVDMDMWEKIILNLLSNAFKYSHSGTISITVFQDGEEVKVAISDTGIGIPEDQQEKIFNRFHRVEHSDGRSQEGTGIGLAMVKELVKLHGGSISVNSVLQKGSTFIVALPVGKEHLNPSKIKEESSIAPINQSSAYVQEAMKWTDLHHSSEVILLENESIEKDIKDVILLVDDNSDMRSYVQRLLAEKYTVVAAVDGMDAYEKLLLSKPELVLTDIMMPKLDGYGLLKKIRNHPEFRNIPVIFLSARAGEEAKVEGLDAGADDYLVKPFSARELVVRIANHIRINQVRRETERQFYQFFLQAPAIINVFKGSEHRFELFHPNNRKILGPVDYTGMTLHEAMPTLKGQGIFELLDSVYETGMTITQQERAVDFVDHVGEHQQRYLNFTYQPWYDLKGKIQGVLNFAIDVTDAVVSRMKVEESERQFRTLAEALPQLVWMCDAEGRQLYTSRRWVEYSGLEPSPESWQKMLYPDDFAAVATAWQKALLSKEQYVMDLRLKNKKGEYRWFFAQAEPVPGEDGSISKWIGSLTDIHDQKEIEQKLEKLVVERTIALQRSNEDLQQFAHVASHDLKEPVRKIKTFSSRLQGEHGDQLSPKGLEFVAKIQSATDRMHAMIEGVLNYSTLNAQHQTVEMLDLNMLLNDIEIDLELAIQQKNAVIEKGDLPQIEGAFVLIYQLFYNLINNSLKFSRDGVVPHISITTAADDGEMASINVADNGIGFDNENADRIFETFTRLNAKDRFEGTGLGLALCKKIVERHHGNIVASGKIDEGAKFTVTLPRIQVIKQI